MLVWRERLLWRKDCGRSWGGGGRVGLRERRHGDDGDGEGRRDQSLGRGGRREGLKLLLQSCRWMVRSGSLCLQSGESYLGSGSHGLMRLDLLLRLQMSSFGLIVSRD